MSPPRIPPIGIPNFFGGMSSPLFSGFNPWQHPVRQMTMNLIALQRMGASEPFSQQPPDSPTLSTEDSSSCITGHFHCQKCAQGFPSQQALEVCYYHFYKIAANQMSIFPWIIMFFYSSTLQVTASISSLSASSAGRPSRDRRPCPLICSFILTRGLIPASTAASGSTRRVTWRNTPTFTQVNCTTKALRVSSADRSNLYN